MSPVAIQPLYTTSSTAQGGRIGRVRSADGILDLQLVVPKEMGGAGGPYTNPEQLFSAAYSACFENAMRLVAGKMGKNAKEASITAAVTFGKTAAGGFGLAVELKGKVPGLAREEVQQLMSAAHEVCPFSNATRGNIEVKLSVEA